MGAPADPRASLAALAAREPEQPGLIYFDEHQARWRWHSWRWLEEAVLQVGGRRGSVGVGAAGTGGEEAGTRAGGAPLVVPSEARDLRGPADAEPWPSVESLLAALARPGLGEPAGRALAALPPLPSGPERPIALLAEEPVAAQARAFLAWALADGAALVVPAGPGLLAWSLVWNRPTHLAIPAADLPALREALLQLEKPRALRRRLRRLRHVLVWTGLCGAAPPDLEAAAWAELGVPLTPWPAG